MGKEDPAREEITRQRTRFDGTMSELHSLARGGKVVSSLNGWRTQMGDVALRDLVGQLRSHRIDRRGFLKGTAALGVSATAVSGALRTIRTTSAANEVVFWSTFTSPAFDYVQKV